MSVEFPCVHRGTEPLESRLCDLCGIKGQPFEVYSCALFGECSLQRKHSQVQGCAACPERSPSVPEVPEQIKAAIDEAAANGRYMVAVFRIEDGQVHLKRTTVNFPTADFRTSAEVLAADLLDEITAKPARRTAAPKKTARAAKKAQRATARQVKKTARANKAKGRK